MNVCSSLHWNYPEINSKNVNHMSEKRKRSIHLPSQQERMLLGHYDPLFTPFQKLPYQNSGIHNQMYKTRFARFMAWKFKSLQCIGSFQLTITVIRKLQLPREKKTTTSQDPKTVSFKIFSYSQ